MALYSATDMAGAGTPITETLTAGTAYNLQLNELISLHKNKTKPRSTFNDGYLALKICLPK